MRRAIALIVLMAACGGGTPKAKVIAPVFDLSSVADLSSQPSSDLASFDQASSHDAAGVDMQMPDMAHTTDAATPTDFSHAPDMVCPYQIGTSCTLNSQCACTSRQTCDATGDSTYRCCVYAGDPCSSGKDCCSRPGVGTGVCSSGVCQ